MPHTARIFFHYNFYWLSCSLIETLCDIRTDEVMYIMLLVIVACTRQKFWIFFSSLFLWLVLVCFLKTLQGVLWMQKLIVVFCLHTVMGEFASASILLCHRTVPESHLFYNFIITHFECRSVEHLLLLSCRLLSGLVAFVLGSCMMWR